MAATPYSKLRDDLKYVLTGFQKKESTILLTIMVCNIMP